MNTEQNVENHQKFKKRKNNIDCRRQKIKHYRIRKGLRERNIQMYAAVETTQLNNSMEWGKINNRKTVVWGIIQEDHHAEIM